MLRDSNACVKNEAWLMRIFEFLQLQPGAVSESHSVDWNEILASTSAVNEAKSNLHLSRSGFKNCESKFIKRSAYDFVSRVPDFGVSQS